MQMRIGTNTKYAIVYLCCISIQASYAHSYAYSSLQ